MNTIQLKRNLSFSEYQLVVDFLENIGIEIEKTSYSPYKITQEDIISIEKSREDFRNGKFRESSEVIKSLRKKYANNLD